ncbi:MAG: glycoside hydrolase, partial [Actinomycetota bacterium]|nr:glycoside hydrolase [Actinomycetota bacterium]
DSSPNLAIGGGPTTSLAGVVPPASGSPWQIVGTRTNPDGTTTATVWTSPDATTWTATALTGPGLISQARAATTSGTKTVIVGSSGTGNTQQAAVWLSASPGAAFRQVDAPGVFAGPSSASGSDRDSANSASTGSGGGSATMDLVAAGALGVFAAGTAGGDEAMWYSTDSLHWSRLKGAEQVIDKAVAPHVNALLVAANGVYAAGSVADGSAPDASATDASVWSSTDGITWQQVRTAQDTFTGDGDHVINGLANLGTGLVAVGAVRSGQSWSPASWISPEGHSWSQASQSFPLNEGPRPDSSGTAINGVASATLDTGRTVSEGSLAAVGGSPSAQRLWTSRDGSAWSEVALPANAANAADWRAGQVATDGSTTVVIDNSTGSPRVLVDRPQGWTEVSADPAVFGPPRPTATPARLLTQGTTMALFVRIDDPGQVLGTETTSTAVLTSPDGSNWTASNSAPFAGHSVTDATTLANGLVAVGHTSALSSTLGAGPTGASAWFSPDAASWTLSPEPPAVFGGAPLGAARADAVTRLGATVIAVGRQTSSPATPADQAVAWTSADGHVWSPASPLDATAGLAIEDPKGVCGGPQSVVAVGTVVRSGPGSQAMAWSSSDGVHWQEGTVSPTPDPSANESMQSCITTGNGYIAFGSTQGTDGTVDAAVWYSNNGMQWTRQTVTAFAGSGLGPIKDLAVGGTTWLAVSGSGDLTTAAGGNLGVWRTGDAGSTWQRIDTTGAPWTAGQTASVDRVALNGANAVVAGQVDGRLTVWLGTPSTSPTPG